MIKLRRPLCSDVTLRLAVDLTPDEEVCFHGDLNGGDNGNSTSSRDRQDCSFLNNYNNNNNSRGNNSSYSNSNNINNRQGRMSTTDSCYRHVDEGGGTSGPVVTWYSRENTPDKTAKDIYNHEHVLTGGKDFSQIVLDSEFKRHVEEEGNDYKDVTFYSEGSGFESNSTDNFSITKDSIAKRSRDCTSSPSSPSSSSSSSPKTRGSTRPHRKYSSNCFADADLSSGLSDNFHTVHAGIPDNQRNLPSRQLVSTCNLKSSDLRSNVGLSLDQELRGVCEDDIRGVGRKKVKRSNNEWADADNTEKTDDDDNDNDKEKEDDDSEEDGEDGDSDVFGDFELPPAPDELSVDMDEDVDDGMEVIDPSLIMSFHGEMCELDQSRTMEMSLHEEIPDEMTKSIAEEIHDVITDGDKDLDNCKAGCTPLISQQLPFHYPFTMKHVGYLFDKSRHHFSTSQTDKPKRITRAERQDPVRSPKLAPGYAQKLCFTDHISGDDSVEDGESSDGASLLTQQESAGRKVSVSTMTSPKQQISLSDLEVTHRGLHRFIPRHADEINIGIGDPIHVLKECDDLWCEGINLNTGEKGIFPAMYANDLKFLDESDEEEEEYWKFNMKFLGSMEVTAHKGDDVLIYAINKIGKSHQGKLHKACVCTLEINQYGIRMIDKSKDGHEKDTFSHFFALKNISFCGTHPKDNRYFAFITKHPRDYKFACHVFHGNRPTHRARDALGEAFKRFYQEYMAFTHPTEDIYIE